MACPSPGMCGCSDTNSTEPCALEPVCEDYDDYEAQLELLPCPPHPAINEFLHPRFVFASDSELAKLAKGMTPKKKKKNTAKTPNGP